MKCVKCQQEIEDDAVYCPYCGKKQAAEPAKRRKRANGTGTVYYKKGMNGHKLSRPWVAELNKVVIGYFKTRKEAEEALDRLIGKKIGSQYNMTFSEVYEGWSQDHFSKSKVTEATAKRYRRAYDVFKPLHDRKFRDLRKGDFQVIIDEYQEQGKAYDTLSKYKNLITQMSDWAIQEEIIDTNFAGFVDLPPRNAEKTAPYTDEEVQKLKEDGSEAAMLILMMVYTGMRPTELFELPLANYHESYVIGGIKTKAGKNRLIPIRLSGRKYFEYFADRAEPGGLLISGYSGNKVYANYRERDYIPLRDRLGIDKTKSPYSARHTFATWAYNHDMPEEKLERIMGHVDFDTTNIYLTPDPEHLVDAVEKIERKEMEKSQKQ